MFVEPPEFEAKLCALVANLEKQNLTLMASKKPAAVTKKRKAADSGKGRGAKKPASKTDSDTPSMLAFMPIVPRATGAVVGCAGVCPIVDDASGQPVKQVDFAQMFPSYSTATVQVLAMVATSNFSSLQALCSFLGQDKKMILFPQINLTFQKNQLVIHKYNQTSAMTYVRQVATFERYELARDNITCCVQAIDLARAMDNLKDKKNPTFMLKLTDESLQAIGFRADGTFSEFEIPLYIANESDSLHEITTTTSGVSIQVDIERMASTLKSVVKGVKEVAIRLTAQRRPGGMDMLIMENIGKAKDSMRVSIQDVAPSSSPSQDTNNGVYVSTFDPSLRKFLDCIVKVATHAKIILPSKSDDPIEFHASCTDKVSRLSIFLGQR